MRTWMLRVVVVLAAVVVGSVVAGLLLPRTHVAGSAITLHQPPDSVWAIVRDLGSVPRWWPELTSSEREVDAAAREVWRQDLGGQPMTLVVTEAVAPRRLVTALDAPPGSAFGGTWTYELVRSDGGTRVTVTEAGWIANPLFRVMAHVVGLHHTVDGYLTALGRRFGEAVVPAHVTP